MEGQGSTEKITGHVFRILQKQSSKSTLRKRCYENMQQIYRKTPMPKCDFNIMKSHFGMGVLL